MLNNLRELKIGLLLAVLAVVYGFGLGVTFGAFEDKIMDYLNSRAQNVLETVYKGDQAKIDKVLGKAWKYFQRAHLHANGIGTTALAMILLLSAIPAPLMLKKFTAFSLGFGALFYSSFWMFAALKAPVLGGTDEAKEALTWLAVPSSGLAMIGVTIMLMLVIKYLYITLNRK